ncbi:MAG: (2Fe-2S)-binding protein [Armatimonadetes bacterium]|nr:(2Fe-2S)-binding protein [Armatimonadota bacterium]
MPPQLSLFELPPIPGQPASVTFLPSGKSIAVAVGTVLLEAIRQAKLPVAQSCGGFGICSWCKVRVIEGQENLSIPSQPEQRLIQRQSFKPNERASCQAEILGDVAVTTTYW